VRTSRDYEAWVDLFGVWAFFGQHLIVGRNYMMTAYGERLSHITMRKSYPKYQFMTGSGFEYEYRIIFDFPRLEEGSELQPQSMSSG